VPADLQRTFLSRLSRRSFVLEAATMLFLSAALAFIEGGTVAVLLKKTFAGQIDARWHNLAVALVACAGEIANLVSFGWIAASHARPKIQFINALQLGLVLAVGCIGFMPVSPAGLWGTLALVICARIFWSGIVTLRTSVWRNNYPPHFRATLVGRLSIITQVGMALLGLGVGTIMDHDLNSFHWIAPVLAAVGFIGLLFYRKLRVRGERALLVAERQTAPATGVMRPWSGITSTIRVLRQDRRFAQFMFFMFLLGFGNIMIGPALVISLASWAELGNRANATSIAITTTIPYLLMPITVPLWSRMLDRSHVVRFRAIHGWSFVAASFTFMLGIAFHSLPLLYAGSAFLGIAVGGGSIAWNLGHVDFAPPAQTSHYMATHVTLNGVRGLLAPLAAVNLYNALCDKDGNPTTRFEPGSVVLALSVVISVAGCAGFVWLNKSMAMPLRHSRHASTETK
jgi:MFS family permease